MRLEKVGISLLLLMAALIASACGGASTPVAATQPEAPAAEVMAEKSEAEAMADEAMPEQEASQETIMIKEATEEAMLAAEAPTEESMAAEAPADEAMPEDKTGEEALASPAWFNAQLTDVNSGETFQIADFKGKVVLVETMAVWCPLCLQQQRQIQALHELLGPQESLVSLSLDIDPNEDTEILQAHASQNGFDWRYAVAPAGVSREIGQLYGAQFLNPPSTPMLIIDRQGEIHLLPFGQKDAQTLQEAITPLLNEG